MRNVESYYPILRSRYLVFMFLTELQLYMKIYPVGRVIKEQARHIEQQFGTILKTDNTHTDR